LGKRDSLLFNNSNKENIQNLKIEQKNEIKSDNRLIQQNMSNIPKEESEKKNNDKNIILIKGKKNK